MIPSIANAYSSKRYYYWRFLPALIVNFLYEIIQTICHENLSGLFAVRIYVGCLLWQFAVVLSIYFFLIRIFFLFAFVYQTFLVQRHSFFLTKLFFCGGNIRFCVWVFTITAEKYIEPYQTSMMEIFGINN